MLAPANPRNGALTVHQDVELYATRLGAGQHLDHVPSPGRKLWLQVARGTVETDGEVLSAGDGAAWSDAPAIRVTARDDAQLLLFDMAP